MKKGVVFISIPEKKIAELSVLPCEVLHHVISPYTTKNIEAVVNNDSQKCKQNTNIIAGYIEEYESFEEGLVHSLCLEWIHENKERFGITNQQIIAEAERLKAVPNYKHVMNYLVAIRNLGKEKILEYYFDGKFPSEKE